jgi:hypothetical protein
MDDPRVASYHAREATYRQAAAIEAARSKQFSIVRLAIAAIGAIALVASVASPAWRDGALFVLTMAIVAFVVLMFAHERVERRRKHHTALADLNREAQDRIARAWLRLPEPPPIAVTDEHPYATDLDVTGHASLFQLIGPPNTPAGKRTLANWLLRINDSDAADVSLTARQAAVRELAPRLDERQQWLAAGIEARHIDHVTIDPLLFWAESEPWLLKRPWVTAIAVVLAIVTPLLALASGLDWGAPPFLWGVTSTLGWVLMRWVQGPMNTTFEAASGEYTLRPFEQLLALIEASQVESPLLVDAQRKLGVARVGAPATVAGSPSATDSPSSGGGAERGGGAKRLPASEAFGDLQQIVAMSDLRHQALFYVIIQSLFLWDFHIWWLLERWRRRHGHQLRGWLEAVGQVEAIAALASLAHDQPEWTFPRVEPGLDRIASEALGHPLLPDSVRVTNEVTIGPPGTFLLITGSNMSGKSTLLRAIGLNTILALAGAPVCARSMSMPPVILHTSMRVSDSLELGLSLFMASLLRLKRVVDAARHTRDARGRGAHTRLLYLLDEVLQGTNSAERQIAVRTIVRHLVEDGALGVVTTHDLELASAQDFTANADSRHLTETVDLVGSEAKMTFDYKLRQGPATSGNALALLRMIGLDQP